MLLSRKGRQYADVICITLRFVSLLIKKKSIKYLLYIKSLCEALKAKVVKVSCKVSEFMWEMWKWSVTMCLAHSRHLKCVLTGTVWAIINRKENERNTMRSNHVLNALCISGQVTNDTNRDTGPELRTLFFRSMQGIAQHSEWGSQRQPHPCRNRRVERAQFHRS